VNSAAESGADVNKSELDDSIISKTGWSKREAEDSAGGPGGGEWWARNLVGGNAV
jgi:hypothetical protein